MKIELYDNIYLNFRDILDIKLHKKFFHITDINNDLYYIISRNLRGNLYTSTDDIQKALKNDLNE
jgi:hypothetical protein